MWMPLIYMLSHTCDSAYFIEMSFFTWLRTLTAEQYWKSFMLIHTHTHTHIYILGVIN
jgi:hypothetical protein